MNTTTRPITITQAELRAILARVNHAEPIGFTALTEPEQRKGPWGVPVKRLVKVRAMTGYIWQNAAAKAGQAAGEDRAWGERAGSALVEKPDPKGGTRYYLPTQNPRYSKPLYLVPGAKGRLSLVPTDSVTPYLRQRADNGITYKDFNISHLVALNLNGRRYRVRQTA